MKIAAIAFVLVLIGFSGGEKERGRSERVFGAVPTDSLERFAEEFWRWRAGAQPYSTDDIPRIERPGGHRDWSRAAIARQRQALAVFEERWRALDPAPGAPRAQVVDFRLMGAALARVKWELEINPRWKRDPNFYIDQTLTPLLESLVVPALGEERTHELLVRTGDIPEILRQGQANLENPPAPFARVAIDSLAGIKEKLLGLRASLAPATTASSSEWEQALTSAGRALEEYRAWLQNGLPRFPEKTALGTEVYDYFLKNVALLPYSAGQLLEMSQQEWARTVAFETYEAVRDGQAPELRAADNQQKWISKAAEDEKAIREFLETRGILTVPQDVRHYTFRAMPEYLRQLSAYGETDDFTGPSRLNENGTRYVQQPSEETGFFWRATAQDPRPIIVHEGVPGHYFQLALSWRNPDPIRRHYYDSGANEGIGFYAEEMMLQAGLFDDSPRTREIVYHFMRLRALRVEVDVKLALGQFSLEQAAEYLENKVPMDRQTARAEASMFAEVPGQAISYQVGKMQIMGFLADARRAQGREFNLRKFHDFLWRNGNVPIALQEWEYLGKN